MAATTESEFIFRAVDRTQQAFKSINKNLERLSSGLSSVKGTIATVVGLGGLGLMISRTVQAGDEIEKLSKRLGVSASALSEYKNVADKTGVSFELLTTSFDKQRIRIAQAAEGTGPAVDALNDLNLAAGELKALSPDAQFERIAEAMALVPNEADRARIATQLWEESGTKLLQSLDGGVESIRALREQANELGNVLDDQQARTLAEGADAWDDLTGVIDGLFTRLTVALIPAFVSFVDFVKYDILPAINSMVESFKTAWTWVKNLGIAIGKFFNLLPEDDTNIGKIIIDEGQIMTLEQYYDSLRELGETVDMSFQNSILSSSLLMDQLEAQAERQKQLRQNAANHIASTMTNLTGMLADTNRNWFNIHKAFAVAEASINTYVAATNAYAKVPYPFNFAASAAVVAAGLVRVQQIASMQPGGRATSGGAGSPPASQSSAQELQPIVNQAPSNQFNITLQVDGKKLDSFVVESFKRADATDSITVYSASSGERMRVA